MLECFSGRTYHRCKHLSKKKKSQKHVYRYNRSVLNTAGTGYRAINISYILSTQEGLCPFFAFVALQAMSGSCKKRSKVRLYYPMLIITEEEEEEEVRLLPFFFTTKILFI